MSDQDRAVWAPMSAGLLVVCLLAATVHLAPFLAANALTPAEWTFTGNTRASPDYMQYRVWMRTDQRNGPLVANTFTSEPNPPHLPVVTYWAFGAIARVSGLRPEIVYEIAGSVFTVALVWLIWSLVSHVGRSRAEKYWTFGAILVGGGLGSHLRVLSSYDWFQNNRLTGRLLAPALQKIQFVEEFRGSFVLQTLLDTHFLVVWTSTLLAALMAYETLRRPTALRWIATLLLFGLATLIHIYDGVVLLAILAGVVVVLWCKGLVVRQAIALCLSCSLVVGLTAGWQVWMWRRTGLPLPDWTGVDVLFSVFFAGFPLVLALLAWGGREFALRSGLTGGFLLGWALGLSAMMLSGPFFAFPMRGATTLAIPLTLIAGRIYFRERTRVPLAHAALAVLLIGGLPVQLMRDWARSLRFRPDKTHIWLNRDHLQIIEYLKQHTRPDDLLLVDQTREAWRNDVLWLAPEFPGRLYCGHFFLTVDFPAKRKRVTAFYQTDSAAERAAFLGAERIRWIFAGPEHDLTRLLDTPGVVARLSLPEGVLLERTDAGR
jgi:hypothetical protein